MRPALKAGLLPVWRNRDTLQIGIDSRRAVAVTGMRGAGGLLQLLDGSRDRAQVLAAAGELGLDPDAVDRVIALLAAGGVLSDVTSSAGDGLSAGLRAKLAPELATAALAHGDADGGARTLARRRAACVRVHGASRTGLWTAALLTASGVGLVVSTGLSNGGAGQDAPLPPEARRLPGNPPTGQPPTGQPPTGQPPTGQPPTGQPLTAPPLTAPPLTAPPLTAPPLTAPPLTGAPLTGAPLTGAPPEKPRTGPPLAALGPSAGWDARPASSRGGRAARTKPRRRPDLVVLADTFRRDLSAALSRSQLPHLAVSAAEAIGVVGPLVLPGHSVCLRCLDMTRAERDPAWPLILAQLASRTADPAACDAVLAAAVAAQATAQALAFIDRGPAAVAAVNGTLELVLPGWRWRRRTWPQHPHCDCRYQ